MSVLLSQVQQTLRLHYFSTKFGACGDSYCWCLHCSWQLDITFVKFQVSFMVLYISQPATKLALTSHYTLYLWGTPHVLYIPYWSVQLPAFVRILSHKTFPHASVIMLLLFYPYYAWCGKVWQHVIVYTATKIYPLVSLKSISWCTDHILIL